VDAVTARPPELRPRSAEALHAQIGNFARLHGLDGPAQYKLGALAAELASTSATEALTAKALDGESARDALSALVAALHEHAGGIDAGAWQALKPLLRDALRALASADAGLAARHVVP
jgi:hypothetical protein